MPRFRTAIRVSRFFLIAALFTTNFYQSTYANEIVDWNQEFLNITQESSGNLVAGPPEVARDMAILGNAMSDAVNASTGAHLSSYAFTGGSVANASATVAAATAAYTALSRIFNDAAWQTPISTVTGSATPNNTNVILANTIILPQLASFLTEQLNSLGLTNPAGCRGSVSTLCNGYNLGIETGSAVIAKQTNDGAIAAIQNGLMKRFPAGSGTTPGIYVPPGQRPEMFPAWGSVTPTGITAAQLTTAQSTVNGPPTVGSSAYAAALLQTECQGSRVALGSLPAVVRTACSAAGYTPETTRQATAALFWNDPGTTIQPPGHWLQIADTVMQSQNTTLMRSAQLSALLGDAENNAGIAAWGVKYRTNLWRPVTAIRSCDKTLTGTASWNSGFTSCDPTWSSLIATPPHPDYVAGHPAFSGAAATVLADFFGTDNISFSSTSNYYCNAGTATFNASNQLVSCTLNGVTYAVADPKACDVITNGTGNGSPLICPVTETFASFSAASSGIDGAEYSRVAGGIHTPFAVADALTIGRAIGAATATDAGLPAIVPEPSSVIFIATLPIMLLSRRRRLVRTKTWHTPRTATAPTRLRSLCAIVARAPWRDRTMRHGPGPGSAAESWDRRLGLSRLSSPNHSSACCRGRVGFLRFHPSAPAITYKTRTDTE